MKLICGLLVVLATVFVTRAGRFDPLLSTTEVPPVFDDTGVVQFVYYPENQDPITVTDLSLLCSLLNPSKKTVIYFYGLTANSSIETDFVAMKNAYLSQRANYDFLVFDVPLSVIQTYPRPETLNELNVAAVSIDNLAKTCIDINNVQLLGFSVGAQIAGYVARQVQVISNGTRIVSRIFGLAPSKLPTTNLDPADPEAESHLRLDKGDAVVVVIILPEKRWTDRRIDADVTFYPNGDEEPKQPACWYLDFFHDTRCAVKQVQNYWAEAVATNDPNSFLAASCNNYYELMNGICNPVNPRVGMNPFIPDGASGKYFLNTNKLAPYSQGDPFPQ